MALTLVEAAKLNSGQVIQSAVIEMFARESDILRVLPFEDIAGNAMRYNREEALPGIAFRGVNESYSESTGVVNPIVEALAIAGGDLDVDRFIVQTQGAEQRAVHERLKVKALAAQWASNFIKGDSTVDPRQFDGLQVRLTGSQLVNNGATSGGDALSLIQLDNLIDQVPNCTHLIMNKAMRRLITAASRNTTVAGYIEYTLDEFGRRVTQWQGIPIVVPYSDNGGTEMLDFTEANPGGGGAASTSIYAVSFGPGMLTGIQNGIMDVRDLGELQTAPKYRTRVEWYAAIAMKHGRAAARLNGIKNAAVVA